MKRSDIPNIITILRIGLVPVVVTVLWNQMFVAAMLIFALAGISDGVDGYIAKRYHYTSRLGSILDPLADKLLLVSTFITLGWMGLLPLWLVAAVLVRDILIVVGALCYHRLIGEYELEPSIISKINTFFQIVLGLTVVLSMIPLPLPEWLPEWLLDRLIWTVFVTTVMSGIDYVWTWSKRAIKSRQ